MNNLIKESHFIGGQWITADNTYPVFNPATQEVRARVAFAGAKEAAKALEAAEQALPAWKQVSAAKRSEILYRWYQLMLDNSEALAVLMSEEQGKCLQEARGEVRYAASFLQWFAEEAKRVYGDIIPAV
ncbi:MAG: aldehyde dehydrogenase family protein, partial [Plesiomonas sp.]